MASYGTLAYAENPVKATNEAELSEIYDFKPLVDRSQEVPQLDDATMKSIYGEPAGTTPFVLTGRVENLENAIRIEHDEVDWYGWYLGARTYLSKWGGLDCAPGTPIKFYRNGVIEVDSTDIACMNSVAGKIYPLPAGTQLDAVILPVRLGKLPPASQPELFNHIKSAERKY
jgi:hypothetical protein